MERDGRAASIKIIMLTVSEGTEQPIMIPVYELRTANQLAPERQLSYKSPHMSTHIAEAIKIGAA